MNVHLISMPMTIVNLTPIQIGSLKSYIDYKFKDDDRVTTHTYSAYLSIMLRAFSMNYTTILDRFYNNNEMIYFMLVLKEFKVLKNQKSEKLLNTILGIYNKLNKDNNKNKDKDNYDDTSDDKNKNEKKFKNNITKQDLSKIEKATLAFIERDLVPKLSKTELNIVGFTLSNDQSYASLFGYLYLKEKHPNYKILFLFGGGLVSYPRILKLLKKFDVKGLAVIGEGELKLEQIITACLEDTNRDITEVVKRCATRIKGVYDIGSLSEEEIFSVQSVDVPFLSTIEDLPLPDYGEYFTTIRKYCADEETYLGLKELKTGIDVILEGSRGCSWGKCDFCFDQKCDGITYRSKSVEKIYESALTFLKDHKVVQLNFVDSICDSWVTNFCELLLSNKINVSTSYELRAIHGESFYTRLALTGCNMVQIGIEALSDPLLHKMNKGALLVHNLQVMKYLKELGVENCSNLIVNHPKSDLVDIENTKEVLGFIPHFPKLNFSVFALTEYSWIYNDLTETEKRNLEEIKVSKMPLEVKPFFTNYIQLPQLKQVSDRVKKGWTTFTKWHKAADTKDCYLNVFRLSPDTILIKENRYNKIRVHLLSGNAEKIYTLCHAAKTMEELLKETGLEKVRIESVLRSFIEDKLLINASNRFLSLALRPRDELINNYYLRRNKTSFKS